MTPIIQKNEAKDKKLMWENRNGKNKNKSIIICPVNIGTPFRGLRSASAKHSVKRKEEVLVNAANKLSNFVKMDTAAQKVIDNAANQGIISKESLFLFYAYLAYDKSTEMYKKTIQMKDFFDSMLKFPFTNEYIEGVVEDSAKGRKRRTRKR